MAIDDALDRLRTGLDERERIARAATELPAITPTYPTKRPSWEPERWQVDQYGSVVTVNGASDPVIDADYGGGGVRSKAVAEHVAVHDPADALKWVEAIRKVIAAYETAVSAAENGASSFVRGQDDGFREALEFTVETLAGAYPDPTESEAS